MARAAWLSQCMGVVGRCLMPSSQGRVETRTSITFLSHLASILCLLYTVI